MILASLPATKERAKQFVTVETQCETEQEEPEAERPQTPQNEEPSVLEPMEKTPEKSDELVNQVTSSTNVSSTKICPPSSSIQVVPPSQPAGRLRYETFADFDFPFQLFPFLDKRVTPYVKLISIVDIN